MPASISRVSTPLRLASTNDASVVRSPSPSKRSATEAPRPTACGARADQACGDESGAGPASRPIDAGKRHRHGDRRDHRHDGADEERFDERVARRGPRAVPPAARVPCGQGADVRAAATVMSGFSLRKLFSPMPRTFIRSSSLLEAAVLLAVFDDPLRRGAADAGQRLELRHRGGVQIDRRACRGRRGTRRVLGRRRLRRHAERDHQRRHQVLDSWFLSCPHVAGAAPVPPG